MNEADELRVVENRELRRYEAVLDGELVGFSEYRPIADRLVFTHTEVDPRMEGKGIGSRLVAGVLDDVRERGVPITVHCPFIRTYIKRHPEYEDLVQNRPDRSRTGDGTEGGESAPDDA